MTAYDALYLAVHEMLVVRLLRGQNSREFLTAINRVIEVHDEMAENYRPPTSLSSDLTGPLYVVELQDGVERQRIPAVLYVSGQEIYIRLPEAGLRITAGSFENLEIALIRDDDTRLFSWPVDIAVDEGDVMQIPQLTFQ